MRNYQLSAWAARHDVSAPALSELQDIFSPPDMPKTSVGCSEASLQQRVRIYASSKGARLWRNNRGAAQGMNGRPIRFGLANDSSAIDKHIKSSDLIGITPVGGMAVFTSYEIKKPGWTYKGIPREKAQLAWINLIKSLGGIAGFITQEEQIWNG